MEVSRTIEDALLVAKECKLVADESSMLHTRTALKENFTKIHFIVRIVFMVLSVMVALIFLCKMCRINRNARKTYDQKVL